MDEANPFVRWNERWCYGAAEPGISGPDWQVLLRSTWHTGGEEEEEAFWERTTTDEERDVWETLKKNLYVIDKCFSPL